MSEREPSERNSTERDWNNTYQASYHMESGLQAIHGGQITARDINYNYGLSHHTEASLQECLHFPEMTRREHNIEDVHYGTGRWLLDTDQYLEWAPNQDEEGDWTNHLLWIMGNAGAGKSTLMKMAVDHAREEYQNMLILPHFFNARGSALERSSEGMYRTLLSWLLEQLPSECVNDLKATLGPVIPRVWGIPQLARLLKVAVKKLGVQPVIFFIDALDECAENEVHAMLKVFRDLVRNGSDAGQRVYVCFASRPYPHFGFKDAEFLDLGAHEEHNKDIIKYIRDELWIGRGSIAQMIRKELQRKAAGIFMWSVLVVRMLNDDFNSGNISELQQRLKEIPPGLHELFRYTLERYQEDRAALLVCLQWLLFAGEDLRYDTLWWGVQLGLGRQDMDISQDYAIRSLDDMERSILNISKGLVTSNRISGHAQFVHESVREFVFKESELQKLYSARDREDFEAGSHERLRDWCVIELAARRPSLLEHTDELILQDFKLKLFDQMGWFSLDKHERVPYPCALYANNYVMHHAEAAQQSGRTQRSFLQRFVVQFGPYFLSSDARMYHSPIGLLVDDNHEHLIRGTQLQPAQRARQRGEAFGLFDEVSQESPVVAVLRRDQYRGLDALLDIYLQLDQEVRHPRLQQILQSLAREWDNRDPRRWESDDNPLLILDVACIRPLLAAFFLIVMAPPKALEPHLDALEYIIAAVSGSLLSFLRVLQLFISHRLPTDAIDCIDTDIQRWVYIISERPYAIMPGGVDVERTFAEKQDAKEVTQICTEIHITLGDLLEPYDFPLPFSSDDED